MIGIFMIHISSDKILTISFEFSILINLLKNVYKFVGNPWTVLVMLSVQNKHKHCKKKVFKAQKYAECMWSIEIHFFWAKLQKQINQPLKQWATLFYSFRAQKKCGVSDPNPVGFDLFFILVYGSGSPFPKKVGYKHSNTINNDLKKETSYNNIFKQKNVKMY